MNTSLEKIQEYFEGGMTSDERRSFEIQLQNNDEMKREVEWYKKTVKAARNSGMKVMLDEIHNELEKTPNSNTSKWLLLGGVILTIVTLICIYFFNGDLRVDEPKAFAMEIKAIDGLPVTLSSEEDVLFNEMMIEYRQGNYDQALIYIQDLESQSVTSDTLMIYKASSLTQVNRLENAASILEELIKNEGNSYKLEAKFLLAQVYLKSSKTEQGKSLLLELNQVSPSWEKKVKPWLQEAERN